MFIILCWANCCTALTLDLSATSAPPGGIAVVHVALDREQESPATIVLDLQFDPNLLTALAVESGPASGGGIADISNTESGAIAVFYGGSALSDGQIATIFLEVAPDSEVDSTISITGGVSSASTVEAVALPLTVNGTGVAVQALSGAHRADTNANGRIGTNEVLRAIQLYSFGALYCDESTEDGYSGNEGPRDCAPHDLDFEAQDWRIGLSELLRCIQFYNAPAGAYHRDSGGEDGFRPGLDPDASAG